MLKNIMLPYLQKCTPCCIIQVRCCHSAVGGYAPGKGVVLMITYSELFQFCLVIISIVSLVVSITRLNKKK